MTLPTLLSTARHIVITCHVNPDGDAIGSCLAMAEYVRWLGGQPTVIVPNQYPDFLTWLPQSHTILRYDKRTTQAKDLILNADLIVCLDFNNPSRLREMGELIAPLWHKCLMIDHHLDPQPGCLMTISRPELSSTCELLFSLIYATGAYPSLSPAFATCIYCGMMTDTGGFTYNSTRPEIFRIIAELLTKGIDKDKIYRNVFNTCSPWRMRLMGYMLYRLLHISDTGRAAYFVLTADDLRRFHFIKGDAEGFVNLPLQIAGVRLSISLRQDTERPDSIWVSLRSVDDMPANLIAERFFGGGGHLNAAGGHLDLPLPQAEQRVREAILWAEREL